MKKFICGLLVLVCVLGFSGCKAKEPAPVKEEESIFASFIENDFIESQKITEENTIKYIINENKGINICIGLYTGTYNNTHVFVKGAIYSENDKSIAVFTGSNSGYYTLNNFTLNDTKNLNDYIYANLTFINKDHIVYFTPEQMIK